MTLSKRDVVDEFTRARHGRALSDTHLRRRIGPGLIELCRVAAGDGDRDIRQKVSAAVKRWSAAFPEPDRVAIGYALAIPANVQHRRLSERVAALARRLCCAERTARRYVNLAFERLADEALAQRSDDEGKRDDDPERGWHVRRLDALLRLDGVGSELIEARTIVATRAGLDRIAIRFSVPPSVEPAAGPRDMDADVLSGALLTSVRREGDAHFRLLLSLPRALAVDEEHTYLIRFQLPPGQPMRPHYALVPLVPCDFLRVRARFDPRRLPAVVWRLDRMAPQMLAGRPRPGTPLALDGVGEVVLEFDSLAQGFGYGVAWAAAEGPALSA